MSHVGREHGDGRRSKVAVTFFTFLLYPFKANKDSFLIGVLFWQQIESIPKKVDLRETLVQVMGESMHSLVYACKVGRYTVGEPRCKTQLQFAHSAWQLHITWHFTTPAPNKLRKKCWKMLLHKMRGMKGYHGIHLLQLEWNQSKVNVCGLWRIRQVDNWWKCNR